MTTANKITILRIILVPVFVVAAVAHLKTGTESLRWTALAVFLTAAISDGIDGYIARHYAQHSELGAILDPIADKLLLLSGIVVLSFSDSPHLVRLPIWLLATILSRDLLLLLGTAMIRRSKGRAHVQPRWSGKVATVLQMATVVGTLSRLPETVIEGICLLAAILTAVSGFQYLGDAMRALGDAPPGGS